MTARPMRCGARLAATLASTLAAALLACAAPAMAATPADIEQLYLDAVRLMTEGRHQEATSAFERLVALEPLHAGAWLELAISHCTLGHPVEAEKLFREIEVRFAPSRGILDIIGSHRSQGCKPWAPRSYRNLSVTLGSDSNVNQGASNPVFVTGSGPDRIENLLTGEFLPKRDRYVQSSLDYARELNQGGATAFTQLRLRRHHSVTEQDTNALLLGLDQPFRLGAWTGHLMASSSLVALDGALYQRQYQLQGRITPPLALPSNTELVLAASLGHVSYVSRQKFDADTGEVTALLNYRGARNQAQASGGLLLEHGESGRLGGDRRGWYASVQWQHQFSDRLGAELSLTRQDWLSESLYAPDVIDIVRDQSTRQLRAALVRPLSATHSLQLELRRVVNKENISLFQYNSNIVQLSWRWSGF